MGKQRSIEIAVGSFMAAGLLALFFLAMQVSNFGLVDSGRSYQIKARFHNIGSLKIRAPVSVSGVRVGRVERIDMDQATYEAVVTLRISGQYDRIPDDTFANIFTAGLLGEQYINLDPGGGAQYLRNGDELVHTQSALVLEKIVGQFLFGKAGESDIEKAVKK